MKSNELRIGNYILHEPTIDDWEEIIVTLPSLLQVDISPESYCGIPLTEEWLLRFGFRGNERQRVKRFVGLEIYTKDLWRYNTKGNNALVVEYVHQLQNLYFALTGEELELKERQDA